MGKRFYAVQHGDDFSCDFGSTRKRDALKMAREVHAWYPLDEVRLCLCKVDDDFCDGEIVVFKGRR